MNFELARNKKRKINYQLEVTCWTVSSAPTSVASSSEGLYSMFNLELFTEIIHPKKTT